AELGCRAHFGLLKRLPRLDRNYDSSELANSNLLKYRMRNNVQKMEQFGEFLAKHQINSSILRFGPTHSEKDGKENDQQTVDKGNGLFAANDLNIQSESKAVVTIPGSALLNAPAVTALASSNPRLRRCLDVLFDLGAVNERRLLISVLLFAKQLSSSKVESGEQYSESAYNWAKYARILPTLDGLNLPVLFNNIEFDCLVGTGVDIATVAKRRKLQAEYSTLIPAFKHIDFTFENDPTKDGELPGIDFNNFVWADAIFWSRVISFASANSAASTNEEPDLHMVPLLDFANHSETPEMNWVLSETLPRSITLNIISELPIQRNSELHISYGNKPNSELLFIHGFAIPNNPHDSVSFPTPIIDDDSDVAQSKMDLILRLDLPVNIQLQTSLAFETANIESATRLQIALKESGSEIISMPSLLSLLIAVIDPTDFIFDSITSIAQLESELSQDPLVNVFLLRTFTVLLDVVQERLEQLVNSDDIVDAAEKGGESVKAQRLQFMRVVRRGHYNILENAWNVIGLLQENFLALDDVSQYLKQMAGTS
ncbi:hypothetical protein HK100_006362, partial [Physocladia obscura]